MTQHILTHLHKILPQEQSWKMNVLRQWETILGPLSKKVLLQRIDDHAVILAVAHPSLAHELLLLTDLIRGKINAAIGHEAITTIHFKTAMQRSPQARPHASPVAPAPEPLIKKPLTPAENKHLLSINNKELRDALADFYATCKERTHHDTEKKPSMAPLRGPTHPSQSSGKN